MRANFEIWSPPALEEDAGERTGEGRDGAIDLAGNHYITLTGLHRHLGSIGWIHAPAFFVSGSIHLFVEKRSAS